MTNEMLQLLKEASMNNENAVQVLLLRFQENKLSHIEQEEIYYYMKQMSHHNVQAIYIEALFYDVGLGIKQNRDMAFLLMREASAKGHAKAIYEVGLRFLEGVGVDQHYDNAREWLEIAADSPHYVREAMFIMGYLYEEGLGIEINLEIAKAWYEKAALKGHDAAKLKLLQDKFKV